MGGQSRILLFKNDCLDKVILAFEVRVSLPADPARVEISRTLVALKPFSAKQAAAAVISLW
jgi:hypothetical protein